MDATEFLEYCREFSDLGVLQSAKKLTYCMRACGSYEYVLSVEQAEAEYKEKILREFSADAGTARQIFYFLCENAILPRVFPDIMMDLREQGMIAMRG